MDGSFDRIEDLPDDGSREKEVYARFGLAAYHAQVFEHGLMNLVLAAETYLRRLDGVELNGDAVDALFADLVTLTAGRLLRRVGRVVRVSEDQSAAFQAAISARNSLTHHFFREHAEDFFTSEGMQVMLDEVDRLRGIFEEVDAIGALLTRAILGLGGITQEHIDAAEQEALARAQSRDHG